ncbi:Asp23/Gls24 family envelope stress response protein [Arthrobacter agilis]|uniref:Asp23/Gls24 family envelope stress response protein n=1 Tax=Arthrobacter agilis TaxID=37921 RepID=UPI002789CE64|nr:Asp23/Gls24 family envelope stress response protein [Arthrobacter agilis]MDQ0734856.1 putative alkaline shock family protein YloU [Arthrobacter agilis]
MATITPERVGQPPAPHAAPAASGRSHRPPTAADTRGTLTITERTVERLAAQSASELPFVSGSGGGVLGVGRRRGTPHRPHASVQLSGRTISVVLDVALAFPSDIAARSTEIRRHVTETLARSTGLHVRRVDITVKALVTGADRPYRSLA